ncbi:MAG: hypothetical protein EBQ56_02935 [Proteobacteria bacterium]|nr:hypothetical protein [Actinomycetota bacterium]NBY46730.1 hypothetical protein [Pseudomonadota bacterium]
MNGFLDFLQQRHFIRESKDAVNIDRDRSVNGSWSDVASRLVNPLRPDRIDIGIYSSPTAITIDREGIAYVCDRTLLWKINADGLPAARWGGGSHGDTALINLSGVAVSLDGTVHATDAGANCVIQFSPAGEITSRWFGETPGTNGLARPRGITVSPDGTVWVADAGNHRLVHFDQTGKVLGQIRLTGPSFPPILELSDVSMTPEGGLIIAGYGSIFVIGPDGALRSDWRAISEKFPDIGPRPSLAVDHQGTVYVIATNQVTSFAPDGTVLASWGQATEEQAFDTRFGYFRRAYGIAVNHDRQVFVTDMENANIHRFDHAGTALPYPGRDGDAAGEFHLPSDIALLPDGTMVVVDTMNHRVQWIDQFGITRLVVGSRGTGPGEFDSPRGIATGMDGRVYVADTLNHRITVLSDKGVLLTSFGGEGELAGQLSCPVGVAVSHEGTVWIADQNNDRIQGFASDGTSIACWDGSDDDGPALMAPRRIAVNPATGTIVVVDDCSVREFTAAGVELINPLQANSSGQTLESGVDDGYEVFPSWRELADSLAGPQTGITFDRFGVAYITEGIESGVVRIPPYATSEIDVRFLAPDGGLHLAQGLCIDASGRVHVADTFNHRIARWTPE